MSQDKAIFTVKKIINKLISIKEEDRVNWCKTIFANLVFVPFKDALKLPILIYGSCKFRNVSGSIEFKQPIERGLLKIGLCDPLRARYSKSYLIIKGKIIVEGRAILKKGIMMEINRGELYLGNNAHIGENCTIISMERIRIGKSARVAHNSILMDCDLHFVVNTADGSVKPNIKPIDIGDYSWLGGYSVVKKGSVIPKGTIVAGPYSMLSKDYSETIPEYSIIAGSPAKLIKTGVRRIFNIQNEQMLSGYFKESQGAEYLYNDIDNLDRLCLEDDDYLTKI